MDELREVLDRVAGPQNGVAFERVRQRRDERRRRRRTTGVVAACALLVMVGAVAIITKDRSPDGGVVVAAQPDNERPVSERAANPIDWRTPTVSLQADDFAIDVAGMHFTGHDPELDLGGDPGTLDEYTTLESIWHENGVEMRLFVYLYSDGVEWWSKNIRIYNGESTGEWIEFFGDYFRSPLGQPYTGDLDLADPTTGASLSIHGVTLRAFRQPAVCATGARNTIDLLYPDVELPAGSTQQVGVRLLDADCRPVAFPDVHYTWTPDDPTIVGIDPRCLGLADGPTSCAHPIANLTGQIPGQTVLTVAAVGRSGEVVAEASMDVRVKGDLPEGPDPTHAVGNARLTPLPAELPDLSPTEELERRAAIVPEERRQLFGTSDDGTITGWANPDERPANAFPIFGFDGKLLGVYVSGLGIIDRNQYDEPGFDPEVAARDKWGDEEYYRRLHAQQEAQQRARQMQDGPEAP